MERHVDQFGFVSSRPVTTENLHRDNARLQKWEDMLSRWDFVLRSRKERLKARVRKGIPDCLRTKVWYDLSGADEEKKKFPEDHFQSLVDSPGIEDVEDQIRRDLARTFPNHVRFQQSDGQTSLFKVLKAYAIYDPEVGYIQGMSFIAAILLTYMTEENAFWVLIKIIQRDDQRSFYLPGMPKAHLAFFQVDELLKTFVPNVYTHFQSIHMTPFLYCPAWFMTVCTHQFPVATSVRIMDCFLSEGLKVIFRVVLALLRVGRKEFMQADMTQALHLFKTLPETIDTDKLIKRAFKFNLSRKALQTLEAKFRAQNSR